MKLIGRRVLILLLICIAIPLVLFGANLVNVLRNFPTGKAFAKMSLQEFAKTSGYRPMPSLSSRLNMDFESFKLSNGFAAAMVCELCSSSRSSCHHDLARESQRWLKHTFEQGPAWVPLKPLQPMLMSIALEHRYDDESLLKIIAYSRLMHSPYSSLDEFCIKKFKFQCEVLTLDQNIQVDIATIDFAYSKARHYNPEVLAFSINKARKNCGLKIL